MSRSPRKPWVPGKQEGYTSFRMVVNICQDVRGNVWSDHTFLSVEDEKVSHNLPDMGVPQVAHALLAEAVKRETYLQVLIRLSKDPNFLREWGLLDHEGRLLRENDLRKSVRSVLESTVEKMVAGTVTGIVSMLAEQGGYIPPTKE